MRRQVVAIAIAASTFAAAPAALAQSPDPSPADLVKLLNDYRTAIGLPGPVPEDAKWSEACRRHNEYSIRNDFIGHSQDKNRPGYSSEGEWAAQVSVLYAGSTWTATRNPFETAPFHLHQLLNPRLDRTGASEVRGRGCIVTLGSRGRVAPKDPVTYTYPASGATHRPSEVASEGPYTPGSRVGIPEGTRTGPYLYLMFDGPWNAGWSKAKVKSASLTGPAGAVELKAVDGTTPGAGQYLPIGAELIPVQPLQPNVTYTASVAATVTDPYHSYDHGKKEWVPKDYDVSHTWSFATSAQGLRAAPGPGARQGEVPILQEADFPAPEQRHAETPPVPWILKAKVRGANVHVTADVGEVGHVTATLSNRRHKGKGKWRAIDVREDSIGKVKLVGRVPVGKSWVRVDTAELEHFQPEVEHGPKDNPEGHSDPLGSG
jgi:hypothetical protein